MTKVKRGLAAEVRVWLERALAARPDLTRSAVIERSGVSRDTFYRLLAGNGEDVEQGTLDRLAAALGLSAPTIVAGLHEAAPAPESPVELVQEAQRLLRRAEGLMAPGAPTVSDGEALRAVDIAKRQAAARKNRRSG